MIKDMKQNEWTFFNEEWNRNDWEDNVDVVDTREESKLRDN